MEFLEFKYPGKAGIFGIIVKKLKTFDFAKFNQKMSLKTRDLTLKNPRVSGTSHAFGCRNEGYMIHVSLYVKKKRYKALLARTVTRISASNLGSLDF